ncbi:YitT family protein [Alkalibacterium kapii]|uniref:Membrane protein n=1 Tax=Alkalibacterium kapii TaxID=426704 RepID=A0A511AT95_9LACT|nr:YitT family protein [Alkalibacterium kapii]GEK90533.1 membrane protein [Alkalibacterium kapii]
MKNKWITKNRLKNLTLIFVGSLLYAISVNAFTVPNELTEGGLTGFSLILFYIFSIPPSYTIFIVNIVILAIGYKFLDKRTLYYTLIANGIISVLLLVVKEWAFIPETMLLAPIGSGLFMGAGIGLIMLGHGTTAGSDIIAKLLQKYAGLAIPTALLLIDILIVVPSGFIIGAENVFLTLINLYIQSKMIDFVLEGLNPKKSFFIISEKYAEVAEAIEQQLGRGITILDGKGYFTKEKKEILYIIISRREVLRVKRIVEMIDPNAFMTISQVQEVTGEGFTYLSEEVQAQRITEAQKEWDY